MSYTMPQVADLLGVSRQTVYRYVERGILAGERDTTGALRVTAASVDAYLIARAGLDATTVSVRAAARALGCWPRTVQRHVAAGHLEAVPAGSREVRIVAASLNAHMEHAAARRAR
jgi:excisionase family DNA binding protein